MGATGSSMVSALDYYKTALEGTPAKCIAMHLIVTPEYIRHVLEAHPDARHLRAAPRSRPLAAARAHAPSPARTGTRSAGSTSIQYIVPGAGGVGEILNNAWV